MPFCCTAGCLQASNCCAADVLMLGNAHPATTKQRTCCWRRAGWRCRRASWRPSPQRAGSSGASPQSCRSWATCGAGSGAPAKVQTVGQVAFGACHMQAPPQPLCTAPLEQHNHGVTQRSPCGCQHTFSWNRTRQQTSRSPAAHWRQSSKPQHHTSSRSRVQAARTLLVSPHLSAPNMTV